MCIYINLCECMFVHICIEMVEDDLMFSPHPLLPSCVIALLTIMCGLCGNISWRTIHRNIDQTQHNIIIPSVCVCVCVFYINKVHVRNM